VEVDEEVDGEAVELGLVMALAKRRV